MDGSDHSGVLAHVGANLRRLRQAAAMSQVELAEASGVSRRTIINLEAGEANISLSGLDQLARALGVAFADLVASPERSRADIDEVMWRGRQPDSVATLLGSAPASGHVELWTWSLAPGERYDASPDPSGWHEMILVNEGKLRIECEDATVELEPGRHAVYSAAQRYSYVNAAEATTRFTRIVVQ